MAANAGDRIIVESEKVGKSPREGEIIKVIESPLGARYEVRWEDGHESTFRPSAGSSRIVFCAKRKAGIGLRRPDKQTAARPVDFGGRGMMISKTSPGSSRTPEHPRDGFEVGSRTVPARAIRQHGEHPETIEPEPGQEPPLVAPRYAQELRR
jgi:hypothetical protein